MSDEDTRRIVVARSLMWDAASGDEQTEWLEAADHAMASLDRARETITPQRISETEGGGPNLRAVR